MKSVTEILKVKLLPFIRSANNYDRNVASDASGLDTGPDSMTQQSFAEECDINTIVRRFGLTGELPSGVRMPTYGDFTGVRDFHDAANAIAMANESFAALPAEVRARFQNDPGAFVDFCSLEANRAEAERLGMVLPKVVAAPPVGPTDAPEGPSAVVPSVPPEAVKP